MLYKAGQKKYRSTKQTIKDHTHIPTFQDKVNGKINKTSIVRSQRKERLSRGGRSDVVGQFVSQVAPATENVL